MSYQYKCLYYGVPKAACTTVKKFLNEQDNPEGRGKELSPHQNPPDSIQFHEVEKEKYKDYFSFSFVRNPWDRIVSCYFNKIREPAEENLCNQFMVNGEFKDFVSRYGRCGFRRMTFSDFVYFVSQIPDWASDAHFRSQHTFINQKHLCFLGRVEQFHEDFLFVASRINPQCRVTSLLEQRAMSSRHGHYSQYYNETTRALIGRRYQKDVEKFAYEFEEI